SRCMCPSNVFQHDEACHVFRRCFHHSHRACRFQADGAQIIYKLRTRQWKATTTNEEVTYPKTLTCLFDQKTVAREMITHVWTVPCPLKCLIIERITSEKLA